MHIHFYFLTLFVVAFIVKAGEARIKRHSDPICPPDTLRVDKKCKIDTDCGRTDGSYGFCVDGANPKKGQCCKIPKSMIQ
jgi:hypothetical protein